MNVLQLSLQEKPSEASMLFDFIDHHMLSCKPETYALIYMYTYRCFMLGGTAAVSLPAVAKVFHVKEDFIVNAWRHWEDEGLLKLTHKNGEMHVILLSVCNEVAEAESKPLSDPASKIVGEIKPAASRPQYTVEELAVYRRQSKDIEKLFKNAEQTLGKLLTYNDMNILFGLYDWLRLPLDVLLYLLSYCAEHGHRNLRYIEKAALDWADNDIDDVEKALAYVQGFDRSYRGILQAMGQTTGYPTPSQKKYIDKWLNTFGLSTEMVMEACDRAAMQIGKPKFTYVDKILEDWHKKGLQTLDDVQEDAENYRKQAENTKAEKPRKKNRFSNFKQPERDYQQLEKMEREYLAQKLKGL
jgi:DnaD/phage-associated family protein